jgi:hypothetical protein
LTPPWGAGSGLTSLVAAVAPVAGAGDDAWSATGVGADTEGVCGVDEPTLAPVSNACAEASCEGVARTLIAPSTPALAASAKAKVVVDTVAVVGDGAWVWAGA